MVVRVEWKLEDEDWLRDLPPAKPEASSKRAPERTLRPVRSWPQAMRSHEETMRVAMVRAWRDAFERAERLIEQRLPALRNEKR